MPRIDCKKIRVLRLNSIDKNGNVLLTNDLAKNLDLSFKVISRMETDSNYNPGTLTLLKVAEYFNVSIDDLLIKD